MARLSCSNSTRQFFWGQERSQQCIRTVLCASPLLPKIPFSAVPSDLRPNNLASGPRLGSAQGLACYRSRSADVCLSSLGRTLERPQLTMSNTCWRQLQIDPVSVFFDVNISPKVALSHGLGVVPKVLHLAARLQGRFIRRCAKTSQTLS